MDLAALPALLLALTIPVGAMAADPLTPAEKTATLAALDDEYHAFATYQAVIAKLGKVRPFTNILRAETQHIGALSATLTAAGEAVPPNPYLNGEKPAPQSPETKAAACALGVQAEIANVALYDQTLLPAVTGNVRLTQVFTTLRDASNTRHLPAFQRCAG